MSYFESDMIDADLFIPYLVQGVVGDVRAKMRVLSEAYNELGVTLTVRAPKENIDAIKKKIEINTPRRR